MVIYNKEKFNLFVDGQFYSGVLKETAITNNFFVGKKIEQNLLDKIKEKYIHYFHLEHLRY